MAMNSLVQLHETKHPDAGAQSQFDSLIGNDAQKQDLLDHLVLRLDRKRIDDWAKRHHKKGLPLVARLRHASPLVILAGEVGCGKTALATAVGTPLAEKLDAHVVAFETPSNIRGNGLVGELSSRVTSAFEQASGALSARKRGLLIIDEGDDLGTTRSQLQAHHEDRAGLNVLIKQIDRLARQDSPVVVLLVTNRFDTLDPALVRRAHIVRFTRPDDSARRAVFAQLLAGTSFDERDLDRLVAGTKRKTQFSYSDLVHRIAEPALRRALAEDQPLSVDYLLDVVERVQPTPLIENVAP